MVPNASRFDSDKVRNDTGNKYGFLDRNGNVVIKPIYDYASSFYHDIATVSLYGQSFEIDKSGKKIN